MNILMMTNTYSPHVGGVARSVGTFTQYYKQCGHRVIVVAPKFENAPELEQDVLRIPAIQNFNGSDFSVVLPVPGLLTSALEAFEPDIVHSSHPFFVGSMALRVARKFEVPLVYTHHTMFEDYTHYIPLEWERLKKFVINLSSGYANMCDFVFAPSTSVKKLLEQRGVSVPVEVVPTGIDCDNFRHGNAKGFRSRHAIDPDSFVIGHLGRLAEEKNLAFLARSVCGFMTEHRQCVFLVAGYGPAAAVIKDIAQEFSLLERCRFVGKLKGTDIVDAYHAMDVFAFSSKTETQGIVLVEAMAAGRPVVALDGPAIGDIVTDGINGLLVADQSQRAFTAALEKIYRMDKAALAQMQQNALRTSARFSIAACGDKALSIYQQVIEAGITGEQRDESLLHKTSEQIKAEWDILKNIASASGNSFKQ